MHPFEVMAEPVRRRIVEILAVGEHPSTIVIDAIRQEFGVTSAAVSHHLKVLRDGGWVDVRRDENERLYVLAEHGIRSLHRDVKRLRRLWKERLGANLPGDPVKAGVRRIVPSDPPPARSRRGLRGRGSDGFTFATHLRRDAIALAKVEAAATADAQHVTPRVGRGDSIRTGG